MRIAFHFGVLIAFLSVALPATAMSNADAVDAYVKCAAYYRFMSPLANPGRKADLEQRASTSTHTVSILRGYVTPMEMEPITKEVAEDLRKSISENTIVSVIEKYEDYCGRVVPERYSTLVTSESRKAYQRMMDDFADTRRESPLMATLGYLLGSPTLFPELSPLGPFEFNGYPLLKKPLSFRTNVRNLQP